MPQTIYMIQGEKYWGPFFSSQEKAVEYMRSRFGADEAAECEEAVEKALQFSHDNPWLVRVTLDDHKDRFCLPRH